jgi:hypothetical protein
VFTLGRLYTPELKPVGPSPGGGHGHTACYVPAAHGPLYLALNRHGDGSRRRHTCSVTVHVLGDHRPLLTLPPLDGQEALYDHNALDNIVPDRYVHLIPDARLIVVLPASGDRLILHRFDLDAALEKAGIDYLYVSSRPPRQVQAGGGVAYQLKVKSKKGGARYQLADGPPGMKLSPAGRLTWRVPADYAQAETDVLVTVSDTTGQEVLHSFKLALASPPEPKAAPPAAKDGAVPEAAWEHFTSVEGGFSALFPVTPEASSARIEAGLIGSAVARPEREGTRYEVTYIDHDPVPPEQQKLAL